MYEYTAYNLCIHSEVELPGLPPGEGSPDVTIQWSAIQPRSRRELQERQAITGRIPGDLAFRVQGGTHIYIARLRDDLPDAIVQMYLHGTLMAIILRQRGLMVLHASSVARDGRAIGFVGDSGWGKSTLADYFCQQGYDLINDDVMAIELSPSGPCYARPGGRHIRLRPGSGAWLHQEYTRFDPLVPGSSRRIRYVTDAQRVRVKLPLERLYILEPGYAAETQVLPLPPAHALLHLVHHTRVLDLNHQDWFQAQHFEQANMLIHRLPIRLLRRAYGLDELASVVEQVERDLIQPCARAS